MVLHLAAHQFIVLSYLYRDFVFDQIFRIASLISTFVSPVRLTTIAVTQLRAYNVDERLEVAYVTCCKGQEMLKLDYVSCILTIISTVLIGKKLWQGWVIAGANSIIICVIGMRSAQFGFVPANLFCIGLYVNNLWNWRPKTEIANCRSRPQSHTW